MPPPSCNPGPEPAPPAAPQPPAAGSARTTHPPAPAPLRFQGHPTATPGTSPGAPPRPFAKKINTKRDREEAGGRPRPAEGLSPRSCAEGSGPAAARGCPRPRSGTSSEPGSCAPEVDVEGTSPSERAAVGAPGLPGPGSILCAAPPPPKRGGSAPRRPREASVRGAGAAGGSPGLGGGPRAGHGGSCLRVSGLLPEALPQCWGPVGAAGVR